jgi:serine/threonine protein kinase
MLSFIDSRGNPRCITNSKGRKRRPGSKDLSMAIKTHDVLFLDFIKKCLIWDPSQRMKPEEALQHAWIQEGFHSRPRATPRPLHISPSSSAGTPSHYFSHTLPTNQKVRSNSERPGEDSPGGPTTDSASNRRRLHPVGSDSQPKPLDPRRNGFTSKRSSLILDSTGCVMRGAIAQTTDSTTSESTLVSSTLNPLSSPHQ